MCYIHIYIYLINVTSTDFTFSPVQQSRTHTHIPLTWEAPAHAHQGLPPPHTPPPAGPSPHLLSAAPASTDAAHLWRLQEKGQGLVLRRWVTMVVTPIVMVVVMKKMMVASLPPLGKIPRKVALWNIFPKPAVKRLKSTLAIIC